MILLSESHSYMLGATEANLCPQANGSKAVLCTAAQWTQDCEPLH